MRLFAGYFEGQRQQFLRHYAEYLIDELKFNLETATTIARMAVLSLNNIKRK